MKCELINDSTVIIEADIDLDKSPLQNCIMLAKLNNEEIDNFFGTDAIIKLKENPSSISALVFNISYRDQNYSVNKDTPIFEICKDLISQIIADGKIPKFAISATASVG